MNKRYGRVKAVCTGGLEGLRPYLQEEQWDQVHIYRMPGGILAVVSTGCLVGLSPYLQDTVNEVTTPWLVRFLTLRLTPCHSGAS
jgi:hypothetical protein